AVPADPVDVQQLSVELLAQFDGHPEVPGVFDDVVGVGAYTCLLGRSGPPEVTIAMVVPAEFLADLFVGFGGRVHRGELDHVGDLEFLWGAPRFGARQHLGERRGQDVARALVVGLGEAAVTVRAGEPDVLEEEPRVAALAWFRRVGGPGVDHRGGVRAGLLGPRPSRRWADFFARGFGV